MNFFWIYFTKKKESKKRIFLTNEYLKRYIVETIYVRKKKYDPLPPVLERFHPLVSEMMAPSIGPGRFGFFPQDLVVLVRYWLAVLKQVLIRNHTNFIFCFYIFLFLIWFSVKLKIYIFLRGITFFYSKHSHNFYLFLFFLVAFEGEREYA